MSADGRTIALLVAAGSGTRAGGELPKQYRGIGGKPLLVHAAAHLVHPRVDAVRVVIGLDHDKFYREAFGNEAPPPVIGGATRRQSVLRGLDAIAADGGADKILIHDAARPFLPPAVIDRLLDALETHQGAIPVLPVADTLVRFEEEEMGDTVTRDGLYRVQTPQAFLFETVMASHREWPGELDATDDAQMVRAAGHSVTIVAGDPMLNKITYPEDLERAEQRIAANLVSRTGMGFDVHALAAGEELWLGGILIPYDRGLRGHSDADVALHAVTDALLGSIAEGDIGQHFPPSDAKWRGAASSRFLEHARDLIALRGGRIDHVDLTIICEAPKIGPHRDAIRARISELLFVSPDRISVKATTTERLGFTGRGEGIAAQAIATVRLPEGR